MEREWVTVAEACEITGRAKPTIIVMVQQRRIPAYRSGGTWLLYRPAVEDYARFAHAAEGIHPGAVGAPLAFLGHGRVVRWHKRMRHWGNWWEDPEIVRLLEEKTQLEDILEELCQKRAAK